MNSKVSTAKHLLKENMFRYVVTTAPSKGLALVRCARHSTAMTKFGSYMRSVVPEAGVNGRDKLSHPTISVGCDYLSLSLISASSKDSWYIHESCIWGLNLRHTKWNRIAHYNYCLCRLISTGKLWRWYAYTYWNIVVKLECSRSVWLMVS